MSHWLDTIRIVAITDRTRMVDPDVLAKRDWPAIAAAFGRAIGRAIARFPARSVLVQIREKDLDGGPLLALARAALATGARVAINDRVDVAIAAGAHGVHLPEHGLAIADARAQLASDDLVLGISCHDVDAVAAAARAGADLIQLGPIWATPSKPAPLGPAILATARAALDAHPRVRLVAVGGIEDRRRVELALHHGADAVAAIRAAWSGALAPAIAHK